MTKTHAEPLPPKDDTCVCGANMYMANISWVDCINPNCMLNEPRTESNRYLWARTHGLP